VLNVLAEKSTPTCVVAECGGKITAEEFRSCDGVLDAAIEASGGKATAVFYMTSSPMDADWAAFKDDWAMGTHEYRELAKVAYVGDVAWVDFVVKAFGWITRAEEKTFPADQLDEAIAWACAGRGRRSSEVAPPARFERATPGLGNLCSIP
jgi:hypothetical protein